ncbi:MAG: shikimate dehydrogenase [Planctomycetes bacterium]|nr:shikimate dehydrogenase [Planctomycetota bacterium]
MPLGTSFKQEICSLFGYPVAGNPTQYMMERAFAHHGLDWRYLTLEIPPESLEDAVRGMRAMGFRGGNITLPHKTAVVPLLDRVSEAAGLMGAVNCIVREGNSLVGENADGKGFLQSLAGVIEPAGARVVLLGAGGAAHAIAVELALAGAGELVIVNRTAEPGQQLTELINTKTSQPARFVPWEGVYEAPAETQLLINATSIGLNDEDAKIPVALDALPQSAVVADVIFNPPVTWLLRQARERGLTTVDGLGMLVNQALICFRLWTGIEPDARVMREALEEYLEI